MDWFFTAVTWLGSLYLLLPLSLVFVFLLLWIGKGEQALVLGLSLFMTIISVHAAKLIFRRPRPAVADFDLLVTMPADWSFPSAHTAQATAFFFAITLIAFRLLPLFWAATATLVSVLVIGSVAYSRIYLHVHYISDVVAGLILAVFLVAVVAFVLPALPWFGDTGSH